MRVGLFQLRSSAAAALFALCAGMSALAAPSSASAQVVATAEADARAVMVQRLTFTNVQGLSFGRILPGPTAGVVRVHADGSRSRTGGVTLVDADHQPARFAGRGGYNQQVRVRLVSNTIQLTGPGAPMTVSQFEIGSTPPANLTTSWTNFRLGATTGVFNFPVGARLAVNARQAPGTYTGTFTVMLEYM